MKKKQIILQTNIDYTSTYEKAYLSPYTKSITDTEKGHIILLLRDLEVNILIAPTGKVQITYSKYEELDKALRILFKEVFVPKDGEKLKIEVCEGNWYNPFAHFVVNPREWREQLKNLYSKGELGEFLDELLGIAIMDARDLKQDIESDKEWLERILNRYFILYKKNLLLKVPTGAHILMLKLHHFEEDVISTVDEWVSIIHRKEFYREAPSLIKALRYGVRVLIDISRDINRLFGVKTVLENVYDESLEAAFKQEVSSFLDSSAKKLRRLIKKLEKALKEQSVEEPPIPCIKCGTWNSPKAKYCQNCGYYLRGRPLFNHNKEEPQRNYEKK